MSSRRRCSTCGFVLDEDDFSVKERDEFGNVVLRYPACKDCRRLKVRIATPRLDAAPLRAWIAQRLSDEGVFDTKTWKPIPDHRAPRCIDEIARDWGTSAKRIQEIVKGRVETVSESYADRVLTAAGSPHLLQILWDTPDDFLAA